MKIKLMLDTNICIYIINKKPNRSVGNKLPTRFNASFQATCFYSTDNLKQGLVLTKLK